MTLIRRSSLALLAGVLAACATATPYQPVTEGFGYSEQKLESNRYRVTFAGNQRTPQETVENYVIYRAAELTLEHGYDWFALSDRTTSTEREEQSAMVISIGGFGWGRHYGHGFGIAQPVGSGNSTRYQGTIEVLMRKGKKPADDANAFNAGEIRENLDPTIKRPPLPEAPG